MPSNTAARKTIEYLKALPSPGHKFACRTELAKKDPPPDCERAEFGVHEGKSARIWFKYLSKPRNLWLFDSWQGLSEDWGTQTQKGHFKLSFGVQRESRGRRLDFVLFGWPA